VNVLACRDDRSWSGGKDWLNNDGYIMRGTDLPLPLPLYAIIGFHGPALLPLRPSKNESTISVKRKQAITVEVRNKKI
jgi:hypothetical protein